MAGIQIAGIEPIITRQLYWLLDEGDLSSTDPARFVEAAAQAIALIQLGEALARARMIGAKTMLRINVVGPEQEPEPRAAKRGMRAA
jgi:hypothetical protein